MQAITPDHGDEVMAFPANKDGVVLDWGLYCARSDWRVEALDYKLVE